MVRHRLHSEKEENILAFGSAEVTRVYSKEKQLNFRVISGKSCLISKSCNQDFEIYDMALKTL